MEKIIEIIENPNLEYYEKKEQLAAFAEGLLPYVSISSKTEGFMQNQVLCDLLEGNAPSRPRYILPDYAKFLKDGSEYLNIKPPSDLYEAVNALTILYQYVPSITGKPVYLGNIDTLLEPYINTVSEREATKLLEMFLDVADKTLANGFVHINIGPNDTTVGRHILDLYKRKGYSVPNLSFKYCDKTPDSYFKEAISTALHVSAPYFVNHNELSAIFGEHYGVASCYNTLKIGGGSYTLVRLNLKNLAMQSKDQNDFIENMLPDAVTSLCELINARAKYIVEKSKFFEGSFLVREGLISKENFTSMAGVVGLYECVEILTCGKKMELDKSAEDLAELIVQKTHQLVKKHEGSYCTGLDNKIGFHAQTGMDFDSCLTAGVRYKSGHEPHIFKQIETQGRLHKYFDTGISDICVFDHTAKDNIEAISRVIKGAMESGIKILALSTSDSEYIRITGYLVKRSDIDKHRRGEHMRELTVNLGERSLENAGVFRRSIRQV